MSALRASLRNSESKWGVAAICLFNLGADGLTIFPRFYVVSVRKAEWTKWPLAIVTKGSPLISGLLPWETPRMAPEFRGDHI